MIIDTLHNAGLYEALNKGFSAAFSFLKRDDLASLAIGRHYIEGDTLYAVVARGPGRSRNEAPLETHQEYIDIQYVISGLDEMGWKPARDCVEPSERYDTRTDVAFFTDAPDMSIPVKPGMFAIFFPEDAHQPSVCSGELHKVIVKVPV